jgi:hypothetical protein
VVGATTGDTAQLLLLLPQLLLLLPEPVANSVS